MYNIGAQSYYTLSEIPKYLNVLDLIRLNAHATISLANNSNISESFHIISAKALLILCKSTFT